MRGDVRETEVANIRAEQARRRAAVVQAVLRAWVEPMEKRVLLSASVSGLVNTSIGPTPAVVVYADLNNSGRLDSGEPSTTTVDNNGSYMLSSVPSGPQIIRQVVPSGQRQAYPAYGGGNHITVGSSAIANVNFNDTNSPYVGGTVYADTNGDGTQDNGEAGVAGITIVADGPDLLTAVTDSSGAYSFDYFTAGKYTFLEALPAGQTAPNVTLTLAQVQVKTGVKFGNTPAVTATPTSSDLSGTVIGTSGSYNNSGNTVAKAFDGSLSTDFDGPAASGNYVGLDLGTGKVITQISYAPRSGYGSRMVGGIFQGSDTRDFSGAVTDLYSITAAPAAGSLTTVNVSSASLYRYVRYLSPANSYGNVGEIKFSGYTPATGAGVLRSGTLAIYGGSNNDTIDFKLLAQGNAVLTTVNGTIRAFSGSSFTSVVVDGAAGNDVITSSYLLFDTNAEPFANDRISVAGGDGDDNINISTNEDLDYAPTSAVSIDGGSGADTIQYYCTSSNFNIPLATLHGGDGNDSLTATVDGSVILYGDNGDDSVNAGGYTPGYEYATLNGGAGNDSFSVGDVDDSVIINGGDGIDTEYLTSDSRDVSTGPDVETSTSPTRRTSPSMRTPSTMSSPLTALTT